MSGAPSLSTFYHLPGISPDDESSIIQQGSPMVLQERDINVLSNLAIYFILNSRQIRELDFPDDTTGRITRRRLNKMVHVGYIRRRRMQTVSPTDGAMTPIYHLTRAGREFLAGYRDDEMLLLKPIEPSQPQHLFHYAAVAETHRLFNRAVEANTRGIKLPRWVNEDEPFVAGTKKCKLRTEFSATSKVVCIPDAAFLLEYEEHRLVVYLEQDRDTFFHDRVAARKSPGYEQLMLSRGHREHFPDTTLDQFLILFITPTAKTSRTTTESVCEEEPRLSGREAVSLRGIS